MALDDFERLLRTMVYQACGIVAKR